MVNLTAEMIVDGLVPSDPQVSPDGKWVAFVVAPVGRQDLHPRSAIWLAATDGDRSPYRLTSGICEDRAPRWSPDGADLYFLSDRKARGTAQLHRLSLLGGEAEMLTDWEPGVAFATPLPDGRTVALLAVDIRSEEQRQKELERDDAEVFGVEWRFRRLRMYDIESREIRTCQVLGNRHVVEAVPSPSGDHLAVLTWPTPELNSSLRMVELYVLDEDATQIRHGCFLHTGGGQLSWDHCGRRLYYLAHLKRDWQGGKGIFVAEFPDEKPRLIRSNTEACPLELATGSDSGPFILMAEGLDSYLARLGRDNCSEVRLGDLLGEAHCLSASVDGGTVALIRSAADSPANVWAGSPEAGLMRLTDLQPELRNVAWGPSERIQWTAPDELDIDGLLILPPGTTRSDGPFSLVVVVHGGPYGRFADGFQLDWQPSGQWLATFGYAVLLANPRGSLGRGHAFADKVASAVGTGDWDDIQAGIDLLVSQGVANPDALGIAGWSQGGFMAAWAVGQTNRFKAAIMGAGVSDWGMMVAESDLPHFQAMLGGGAGWEDPSTHRHDVLSPISYVGNVRTPVLILHGAEDERVPYSQGRFFARGLREHGVSHTLIVYPREPHEIYERNHQLDILRRTRAWMKQWLSP